MPESSAVQIPTVLLSLGERENRTVRFRQSRAPRLVAARGAVFPLPAGGYVFSGMVGMARCAIPARVVAGGTNSRASSAFEGVAPLHAARTSQRDVPTRLNRYPKSFGAARGHERMGKPGSHIGHRVSASGHRDAVQRGDFGTCCGRVGYQMYHGDTFDMCLHWRRLQKRTFWDRGFGCKVLMARPFNCGSRNAEFNAALIPAFSPPPPGEGASRGYAGMQNAGWGIVPSSPLSSFFSPNCLPWVRNYALAVIGWRASEDRTRLRRAGTQRLSKRN